jgi:CheY-like chemotaxis protein
MIDKRAPAAFLIMSQKGSPTGQTRTSGTQAATILVVDDDPAVCHLTSSMLEMQGFSVLCASNGQEAIELFKRHAGRIHLLVADIVMPNMTGPQLAQHLRTLSPDLPILFLSGVVSPGNFQGVMGGWMLRKPYSSKMLASKVKEVLAIAA